MWKPIKSNILIERGDAYLDEDRLEIRVPGDWTTYKCTWAVKKDKVQTSMRLFEKNNTLAGGSDEELEAVLDGSETVFKISLLSENTSAFTEFKYYNDLVAVVPLNPAKNKTLAKGEFKVDADVQTPYDGLDETDVKGFLKADLRGVPDASVWVIKDEKPIPMTKESFKEEYGITAPTAYVVVLKADGTEQGWDSLLEVTGLVAGDEVRIYADQDLGAASYQPVDGVDYELNYKEITSTNANGTIVDNNNPIVCSFRGFPTIINSNGLDKRIVLQNVNSKINDLWWEWEGKLRIYTGSAELSGIMRTDRNTLGGDPVFVGTPEGDWISTYKFQLANFNFEKMITSPAAHLVHTAWCEGLGDSYNIKIFPGWGGGFIEFVVLDKFFADPTNINVDMSFSIRIYP